MKQVIYIGSKNSSMNTACKKLFRCVYEKDLENIENFVNEVMTDAIVCDYEEFESRKTLLLEISSKYRISLVILVSDKSILENISECLTNSYVDFAMSESSVEELNARIERIIASKNMNLTLENMSAFQHEVNKMAKLSVAGELIGSVSHMINNPITAINLLLDLLKMDKSLSKEALSKIETIEANIERIISIVSTVRELKLGISDKRELVNINEETVKYIPLLHDYFINHNMNIEIKTDEKLPPVKLPHGLLKYIFLEIMLLIFHRNKERKSGKVLINIFSDKEIVNLNFKANFNCYLEKIGMDIMGEDDEQEKSDRLTINALKADVSDSSGIMNMSDNENGSSVNIQLPVATI